MGYAVAFRRRDGSNRPSSEAIANYFDRHPHIIASGSRYVYANRWTGNQYAFDTRNDGVEPLGLDLNLFRSSVYGIEAAEMIEELSIELDFDVYDEDAEIEAAFSVERFLKAWSAANVSACATAMLMQRQMDASGSNERIHVFTVPGAKLLEHWRWNRIAEREDLAFGLPTSSVRYRDDRGKPRTFSALEVDRPVWIAPVDDVLLICAMDGRPLVSSQDKASLFVRFADVAHFFTLEQSAVDGVSCLRIDDMGSLARELFHERRPPRPKPFGPIELRQIVDEELYEQSAPS